MKRPNGLNALFDETPERIKRGLQGAGLPFVIESFEAAIEAEESDSLNANSPPIISE